MSIWVSGVICSIMSLITYSYIFSKLTNNKYDFSEKRTYLFFLFALFTGNVFNLSIGLRSIIMIIDVMIYIKIIFKENLSKTIVATFLIHIVCALSEMIIGVLNVVLLQIDLSSFMQSFEGIVLINLEILLLAILICRCKILKNIFTSIVNWYETKQLSSLVITQIIAYISILVLLYRNVNGFENIVELIFNNIFVVGIIYFIFCFLIEKIGNIKIKNDYNSLLNYAKTYEVEIVEKSKWQHEYENQLLIIKDKIDPSNKKAINYINKLLKNKPSASNSQWLEKLTKFPDIGIKGLLHYKICQMINNGINVYIDVIDENLIPSKLPTTLLEDNLQDISMAIGVYLDNAMHAAIMSENKYLIVELKCTKEEIVFQISNTYSGKIEIDKLSQDKFTTKGNGHGYGLSIVKDILVRNKCLRQEKELNGIYFVQRLILDIKNKS